MRMMTEGITSILARVGAADRNCWDGAGIRENFHSATSLYL